MSEELKPCPFCGGVDVKLRQHLATNMSWVSCTECGLEAPSETGWTDDIAIEYWNTRSDAAKDAEIEALREALTPSGSTKCAYHGEFKFTQTATDEDGDEYTYDVFVPWTTVKEIMSAIEARANRASALKGDAA